MSTGPTVLVKRWTVPLSLLLGACGESPTEPEDPPPPSESTITLEAVGSGFDRPVLLTAPAGDDRLFIVEQGGKVQVVRDGVTTAVFLDIGNELSTGNEQGLLGLAFHPDYAQNGRFLVSYTAQDGTSRIVEYHADPGADVADADPVSVVLEVEQPFSNHNGGHIVFGPDGMLYIGLGDGGSGGDPLDHGQNLGTLLGSLLRIDIDAGTPYAIPPDNPFVGQAGARPEIWAFGLRNPWRYSFDAPRGLLFIGDVGQRDWEEVDVVPVETGGVNFGWRIMEGEDCFRGAGCGSEALTTPLLVYSHLSGCSVTGGHVYRGALAPSLRGQYLFADFCSGWIRAVSLNPELEPEVTQLSLARPGSISSFGRDAAGESYVLTIEGGVFRISESG